MNNVRWQQCDSVRGIEQCVEGCTSFHCSAMQHGAVRDNSMQLDVRTMCPDTAHLISAQHNTVQCSAVRWKLKKWSESIQSHAKEYLQCNTM